MPRPLQCLFRNHPCGDIAGNPFDSDETAGSIKNWHGEGLERSVGPVSPPPAPGGRTDLARIGRRRPHLTQVGRIDEPVCEFGIRVELLRRDAEQSLDGSIDELEPRRDEPEAIHDVWQVFDEPSEADPRPARGIRTEGSGAQRRTGALNVGPCGSLHCGHP